MFPQIVIAALYRFVRLDDFEALRQPLLERMIALGVRGTILLAAEGINGTVAGEASAIDGLLAWLGADSRFAELDVKYSCDTAMPFHRARVKLKREIVTMGVTDIDPGNAGTRVDPADWNRLIGDPEVTVIDARNDYEVGIGSFEGAVNPRTASFREFPGWADRELDPGRQRKVAMFCTGGIRCEKATAYLRQRGFEAVYHLRGGILNYLEQVPAEQSLWRGECFVFDNRVSVTGTLEKGSYDQCHACRRPISAADRASDLYRPGVGCPHCHAERSDAERARFRERHKQVGLAARRGENHIGADARRDAARRKQRKLAAKAAQRQRSG